MNKEVKIAMNKETRFTNVFMNIKRKKFTIYENSKTSKLTL